jgi:four helix bundle protein
MQRCYFSRITEFQKLREGEMAKFNHFEDMEVWKKSRLLINEVYRVSNKFPFSKDYALQTQIRKAVLSIASNIAEGFERSGNKEFLNFLSIAKGSTGEVKCQLYVALDQGYINAEEFKKLASMAAELSRMLGGLMKYLSQSGMRGNKQNQYRMRANSTGD